MPGGDRTGPTGAGPMSGRGAGYCAGYGAPGNRGFGLQTNFRPGFGGGGRGWRRQYYATGLTGWQRAGYVTPTPEQELNGLKNTAEWLRSQLEAITHRIEELGKRE